MPGIECTTITMPSYWACYLINGDASYLTGREERLIDRYTRRVLEANDWMVVGMVEESERFTWRYRLHGGDAEGGEVADYIVHRHHDQA